MCLRLEAAGIAVPLGDRLGAPASSAVRPDEGLTVYSSNQGSFGRSSKTFLSPALQPMRSAWK
jgi:hypothetical protein